MATNMNVSIRYGSHLPVLLEVMRRTTGDVLELGPGVFSTPVLHWLCESQKRNLLTVESDKNWMYFCSKYYRTDYHKFLLVENWDKAKDTISREWDVALVDHSPSERRVSEIKVLSTYTKYIIVHDADDYQEKNYHLSTIRPLFKYFWRFEKTEPQTAIYSNFIDLKDFHV